MRILERRPCAAVVLALLVGAALAGCGEVPSPRPSHTAAAPAPTPIFTSDADALAAAVAVYKKYESASDAVARDGGANPERIRPYVSESGYEFEKSRADAMKAQHAHGIGSALLNNAMLQSRDEVDGLVTVTMYVCEDLSGVDRVDAAGRSLLPKDRGDYFDYQATLQGRSRDTLVIQSNKAWSGGGICKF